MKIRRKWAVLGLFLLVFGLLALMSWPATDARFVGTWDFQSDDERFPTAEIYLTLSNLGHARVFEDDGPGVIASHWAVKNGIFRLGSESQGLLKTALEEVEERLWSWTGKKLLLSKSEEFEIGTVSANEIELHKEMLSFKEDWKPVRVTYRLVRRSK